MNTSNRNQGFTLIELMTSLSVAAILMGTAVPSFFDYIGSSRSSVEYRELLSGLQFARSEAITRGVNVTVSAKVDADWHQGFIVWADEDGDGNYDAGEELIDVSEFASSSTMTESSNTAAFVYTPEGFLDAVAGANFMLSYRTAEKCEWDRDIRLVYTGHVSARERVCSE